ncbi:helicase-related protein [Arsenicicoccus sp. UBA7492]|uniref:helicase-related protein n=1 Tax=Arsenicicoccus sp. UBA7492 TaxID=1946057 RepID=UPI0025808F3B|nr:helicase-related protein [Arsenicicoccus sp. UBA7492]
MDVSVRNIALALGGHAWFLPHGTDIPRGEGVLIHATGASARVRTVSMAPMRVDAKGTTAEDVAPGSIVWIRDEEWLVTQVGRNRDGILVSCQGLSELVAGTSAQFSAAFDDIEVADPRATRVVPDDSPNYRQSRLWLEAALRKTPLPVDDPHLAVVDGMLADPLDYQRTAVRQALNPDILRPRILLADTVGLGKTLEIGMILSELVRRGRGERILIVTPKHVLEQMQHEMWCRFALPFVRLDSVGIQRVRRRLPATRNPFGLYKRAIISIDTLKNDRYLAHLRKHHWDAVVIDESHNITNSSTQNNRLANVLAPQTDALILASATPHNGKKESFAELVRLLEPTAVTPEGDIDPDELQRLVIRRHRHSPEVATIVGTDWVERQQPHNILVNASPDEDAIAEELADHWLYATREGRGAGDSLFGWTLAKAFLSSPAALAETASNRLKRAQAADASDKASLELLIELASKASEQRAGKYAALLTEFDRIGIGARNPERVVVFAERVATLHWLRDKVMRDRKLTADQVRVLHGGLTDVEQQQIVEEFKQESSPIRVLITGDVASEGVNLHLQCHELIHFDIPWSLIRIEQRNGRIDRYGQRHAPRITTLLLNPSHQHFQGDLRVLTSLMLKEHEAHQALGDSASLMGQHSVQAEEDEILKVLQHKKTLDEAVQTPEQVLRGGDLDALLAQLSTAVAESAQTPLLTPSSPHSASGLYDSHADFLREAVSAAYPRPAQAPGDRGAGGVGWVEHQADQIIQLTPPEDLKARLAVLPQSYLSDRQVTTTLRLATSATKGKTELARALSDEQSSSWPAAHFLGPLHPVLDWVSDRVLARLGRGEIFAVRGDGDSTSVLLQGTLTNKAGQTVSAVWIQVEFPDPSSGFAMVQVHDSAAGMLEAVGVHGRMSNPGTIADIEVLRDRIPAAVDKAEAALEQTFAAAEAAAAARVDAWAGRVQRWDQEASALIQRGDIRQRRVSVEQERALADARRPDRRFLRPLLVVVPADHPVSTSEEGA